MAALFPNYQHFSLYSYVWVYMYMHLSVWECVLHACWIGMTVVKCIILLYYFS